jgi:hypothetical protein
VPPFINHQIVIIGWCRFYLLSLFWKKPSLWSLSTHLSYYLPPASCLVSKDGSIASQTRSEPKHYYARTIRSPQPTQRLPLCYLAEAPSPLWSEQLQGTSVGGLRYNYLSYPLYRVFGLPAYLPTSIQHVLITRRLRIIATQDAQISQDVHNGLSLSNAYTLDELRIILGRQGLYVLSSVEARWTRGY